MTCAELEVLLCDYLDGTLRGAERTALEGHLTGCSACAELAKEAAAAVSFIERAAVVVPPAELLTRILHEAPQGRRSAGEGSWLRRTIGQFRDSVLQPRYAMGMAMTILSFTMLSGFVPRQLRPSDLDPAKIWASLDDRAHRTYDRAMKYYDNLRLVIEVQSRLSELSAQEQAANQNAEVKGQSSDVGSAKPKPESATPSQQH